MNDLEFWNRRLNELKERCTPPTDVELSFLIRLSPAMISQIRTGRRDPPFDLKIKILEDLGYVFDHDLLIRMLPIDHRLAIISAMGRKKSASLPAIISANVGRELPPLDVVPKGAVE